SDYLDVLAVSTLTYNPGNPRQFYFGTGEGWSNADAQRGAGIWESLDGGATWNRVASTGTPDFIYVNKIVVAPNGDAYAATSTGLFKRTAGVGNFVKLNVGAPLGSTIANFTDVEIGYLGDGSRKIYTAGVKNYFSATSEATFFASANDGLTWTASTIANPTASIRSFEFVVDNAYGGLFPGANRVEIACHGNTVYAMCQQRYLGQADPEILQDYLKLPVSTAGLPAGVTGLGAKCFIKSTDGGMQWTQGLLPGNTEASTAPTAINDFSRNQFWYDVALTVDPNDPNVVYTGAIDFWKTSTGGLTWQQISDWQGLKQPISEMHSDHHTMIFHPGNSNIAYFGGDGGVHMSTNMTTTIPTILPKNTGFNVTQFYAASGRPEAGSNYFIAGAQDNGSQQFNSSGIDNTFEVSGGDGCFTAIDQTNGNKQVSSYVYNNYYRRTDGAENVTFSSVGSGSNDGRFVNPFDLADGRDILYSGGNADSIYRWKSFFGSVSKEVIDLDAINPAANADRKPTAVTVSPNNANTVYVGDSRGRLYRLDNAETTPSVTVISNPAWEAETGGFFWISSIDIVKSADGKDREILICGSNYGINSVWVSRDGGATWNTIEGNLPDMPVRWAVFDPRNTNRAFLATELGVFGTSGFNGSATVWKRFSNFPYVRVDMIGVRKSDNVLFAATHGRGLYTSTPLPEEVVDVFTLNSFTGTRQQNSAILNWNASIEDNLVRYDLQRKYGTGVYQVITSVNPLKQDPSASYSYTDAKVQFNKNPVYQLKMVFADGSVQYSQEVSFNAISAVTASYNTNGNELMVQSAENSRQLNVQVYNMSGQLFLKRSVNAGSTRILLSELKRGMYVVNISDEKGQPVQTLKIYRQ
ncbi:MAG: T9SS type A sorting domain-containing protein, partial [Bacteroidota bacterium]|nr:T9SS type A sorting domain-containing protein [Bacteroidota bacterium]